MRQTSTTSFGPYSPVRKAGNCFFIAGQVGANKDKKADPGIRAQVRQMLANLDAVLATANLAKSDIVKTTVFLKNMDDFAVVNKIYMSYFPEPRPARSCVEVAALPNIADHELLAEIEAIAYKEPA